MNSVICKTFTAKLTIGLFRGYSKKRISISEFKTALLKAQVSIKEHYNVELSVKATHCEILFLGQKEPSVELQFIQHPNFQQQESELKKAILALAELMMLELEQNRVAVIFSDETIMLEQSDVIDPKIQL